MIVLAVAYRLSPFHPLWKYPGPFLNKITSLAIMHMVSTGKRYEIIKGWHEKYGKFVRTGKRLDSRIWDTYLRDTRSQHFVDCFHRGCASDLHNGAEHGQE